MDLKQPARSTLLDIVDHLGQSVASVVVGLSP